MGTPLPVPDRTLCRRIPNPHLSFRNSSHPVPLDAGSYVGSLRDE